MTSIKKRVNRKKTQIQHDLDRLATNIKTFISELDRLQEDIDELCQFRNGDSDK